MYSTILVALDGSEDSRAGGRVALDLARALGAELLCLHVYDVGIHRTRFEEMEPGLPERYRESARLAELRGSHDALIEEGFQALSRGYMERYLGEVRAAQVAAEEVVVEGRNYVGILDTVASRAPDLVVLGARGLGAQGDGRIGSTALRVLRRAHCDVLIARAEGGAADGAVCVGVDGSEDARTAVRRGVHWARALGRKLSLAAAYDPVLHQQVFRAMAGSISEERRQKVGLETQERLHEDLIDDGLGLLYQGFLDQARSLAEALGARPEAVLLQGKGYRALADHAAQSGASLVVVGRFGHNREPISDIGSHAEALACGCRESVLVTAPPRVAPAAEAGLVGVSWDEAALRLLERVPGVARPMARRAVEAHARSAGLSRVTPEVFREVAAAVGMGPPAAARREDGEDDR